MGCLSIGTVTMKVRHNKGRVRTCNQTLRHELKIKIRSRNKKRKRKEGNPFLQGC